ncbi:GreA/GreB family elongation factor [uncultured Flavobacterium sp.]|uniref:GreA/GreB family elongation factor n=1 Tax=uncultured Flavobacterium sp. TaxID=165435 RepID=UPI0025F7BB97|nr:GreA/GreB family elongation factor [uncultured Flavobacterium sp.]
MKYGEIIIEKKEYELLRQLLTNKHQKDKTYRASIEKLADELKRAKIMDSDHIPEDIVRLNSIVTIETPFSEAKSYQLVAPEKSDISQNKLSVLAPMGLALFGYAIGDDVLWQFPSGMNSIKILKVEQPDILRTNG